ncbi:MAG: endonuclease Q family protein [Acidobacteria bacterium]|nr:endonuclease Q family protein [Acidobacteriota bacterium]MCI0624479.1 endonuclease Q family protein [Acidobacteriota bacterium]MCI0718970.1 endonuclease Q family protein [Acidobacteriota bacterium]
MSLQNLLQWAPRKGIDLLGTGDCLHPGWCEELSDLLVEDGSGLLRPKQGGALRLVLTAELEAIFPVEERNARIHLLMAVPGFGAVERLRSDLGPAADLGAEAIPSFRMPAAELVERILNASPQSLVAAAHVWSPCSSVYGSKNGFSSLAECFGGLAQDIAFVETGLSSDPGMCWRFADLDGKRLLSASAANSLRNLGRECTLFSGELSYGGLTQALKGLPGTFIQGTIEQVSELGPYFFNGHRECQIAKSPIETHFEGRRCPACRKQLTIGAFQRMLEVAGRTPEELDIIVEYGWIRSRRLKVPPFRKAIPLQKIIAATYGVKGRESHTVQNLYEKALSGGNTEREILFDLAEADLAALVGHQVAEAILRVREGYFRITPGYDGVWGQLEIFEERETAELLQLKLF